MRECVDGRIQEQRLNQAKKDYRKTHMTVPESLGIAATMEHTGAQRRT